MEAKKDKEKKKKKMSNKEVFRDLFKIFLDLQNFGIRIQKRRKCRFKYRIDQ